MDIFNTSVGLLGLVVSVVGLWLTYAQAKQAKDAAEAARDAAEKTLAQSRREFKLYVAGSISSILTELKARIESDDFSFVTMRLGDLHEELIVISRYSEQFVTSIKACATLLNKARAADNEELKSKLKKSFIVFYQRMFELISRQTLPVSTVSEESTPEASNGRQ